MDKLIRIILFISIYLTVDCQSLEKYLIKNEFKNSDTISYSDYKSEQMPSIYINQSNNIHIVAKYGQTVSLPCIIFKLKNQDLSQIHAVWHKLSDRQRATVLSIGNQQIKQDLRYRVKQVALNKPSSNLNTNNENNEALSYDNDKSSIQELSNEPNDKSNEYSIENWQFEIRKVTFDDSGTYQCLLPLVKPITRNITLKILPEIVVDPKEKNFFANQKISINCKANVRFHHSHKHGDGKRNQKPMLNWYKENELVRNLYNPNTKHKIEIMSNTNPENHLIHSVLTIYNAKEEDSGKYTCSYDNHSEQARVVVLSEDFNTRTDMLSSHNSSYKTKLNKFIYIFSFILLVML